MKNRNNALANKLINALEAFLTLDEIIKYFRSIESDLKNAIPHCPTESDERLFKSCLRSAEHARYLAESAMQSLERHGCLYSIVVDPLVSSIRLFHMQHSLVLKRSCEIIELLENQEVD